MAVSEEAVKPKSSHVSDPALAPFLQPTFDPASYLNATLPSLSSSSRPLKAANAVPLADLSSQTQDLLTQLNAHTTRLTAILTQLTDDILRSGGRLAYEVEVLRGETTGLTETLTEGLKGDIEKFVPGGISLDTKATDEDVASPTTSQAPTTAQKEHTTDSVAKKAPPPLQVDDDSTPEYISDLRTLSTVRSRLDTVIKVFGEAMHWTLPPSEVSLTSSLISVSAPEPGSDSASQESKGKEFAAALRSEIADLITGDLENGGKRAEVRIQALRELACVWKGTAEEKARGKFVEGLVKLAEEKSREVAREKEREAQRGQRGQRSGSVARPQAPVQTQAQQKSGGGFLENLQRIRGFVDENL